MRSSNITNLPQGFEYIVGRNVVLEVLKAGRNVKSIYVEDSLGDTYSKDDRINAIITKAKLANVPYQYVAKQDLQTIENRIALKSEGVAAIVEERPEYTIEELLALCKTKNKEPFIIVVNNILYEENLGAILRSCAAGGVDAVIIPKRDKRELTPNVVRISMGGAEYVPLIRANLFEALDYIKKEGIKIIGVELVGTRYYFETDLTGPICIMLGGEDAGITQPLIKRCDEVVKIPMLRDIQSLNVSVSTGIIIYEKIRQECQI